METESRMVVVRACEEGEGSSSMDIGIILSEISQRQIHDFPYMGILKKKKKDINEVMYKTAADPQT